MKSKKTSKNGFSLVCILFQDDFYVNFRKYFCGRDNTTKILDKCLSS